MLALVLTVGLKLANIIGMTDILTPSETHSHVVHLGNIERQRGSDFRWSMHNGGLRERKDHRPKRGASDNGEITTRPLERGDYDIDQSLNPKALTRVRAKEKRGHVPEPRRFQTKPESRPHPERAPISPEAVLRNQAQYLFNELQPHEGGASPENLRVTPRDRDSGNAVVELNGLTRKQVARLFGWNKPRGNGPRAGFGRGTDHYARHQGGKLSCDGLSPNTFPRLKASVICAREGIVRFSPKEESQEPIEARVLVVRGEDNLFSVQFSSTPSDLSDLMDLGQQALRR